jgi:hypothetical protein
MQFFDAKFRICFFLGSYCLLVNVCFARNLCYNMQFEKFNPFTNDQ